MFEDGGTRLSLDQLRRVVETLAERIGASDECLPTFGLSADFGQPHLEVDDRYHWVVMERGSELERRTTADLDELLYWTFQSITFSLASEFELRHRQLNEDFRRGLFSKQLNLLACMDINWASRRRSEMQETLKSHPFVDDKAPGFDIPP